MFTRKFIASQIIFVVLLAVVFLIVHFSKKEQLPRHGSIAPFELTDSLNKKFSLGDLQGKVWVADFMFTTCSDICPMLTKNMRALYKYFNSDDAVRFVSISVNPENDSPEVLKNYAQKNGADPRRWIFLTGRDKTKNSKIYFAILIRGVFLLMISISSVNSSS